MYNDELVMGAHVYAVMNGTCKEASAWVSCVSVNRSWRGHCGQRQLCVSCELGVKNMHSMCSNVIVGSLVDDN